MKTNIFYWAFNLNETWISGGNFFVRIINLDNYEEIYAEWLDSENLKKFNDIMDDNKFAILYLSHESLKKAAEIKLNSKQPKIYPISDLEKYVINRIN